VFLVAFAWTANLHHGATPGLTRYALWLVPLAIPLLADARTIAPQPWRRLVPALALASAALSVWVDHPARPENWTQPTSISTWLWTHRPTWTNPMPEVFAETLRRDDRTVVPTATRQCEKILLGRDVYAAGVWPVPCAPVPLPPVCDGPGTLCYANRAGAAYAIVKAPGRPRPVAADGRVWPRAAEAQVLTWYNQRGWWPLLAHVNDLDALRAAFAVRATTMGSAERFVVVLEQPAADAALSFRVPLPMTGQFLDPLNGTAVSDVRLDGGDRLVSAAIPAGHDILILDMTGVRR
jgi:hypothetical protein